MTKTPASEPSEPPEDPNPALAPRPPVPKRGAIQTPRWEIEAAEPYVPKPDHDHDHAEDVRRSPPEDVAAPE